MKEKGGREEEEDGRRGEFVAGVAYGILPRRIEPHCRVPPLAFFLLRRAGGRDAGGKGGF